MLYKHYYIYTCFVYLQSPNICKAPLVSLQIHLAPAHPLSNSTISHQRKSSLYSCTLVLTQIGTGLSLALCTVLFTSQTLYCTIYTAPSPDLQKYNSTEYSSAILIEKNLGVVKKFVIALNQHHLKRRPDHRKVATSQTSELVGKAPKTCNSYPDAIFK